MSKTSEKQFKEQFKKAVSKVYLVQGKVDDKNIDVDLKQGDK